MQHTLQYAGFAAGIITLGQQQTWDAKDINKLSHIPDEYSAYSAETLQAWSWWYCDLLPIWACLYSLHSMHTCHTGTYMLSGTLRSFRKRSDLAETLHAAAHDSIPPDAPGEWARISVCYAG